MSTKIYLARHNIQLKIKNSKCKYYKKKVKNSLNIYKSINMILLFQFISLKLLTF